MGFLMSSIVQLNQLLSVKERFTLSGKKGFVTGAAGGIGRSTAAAMAELGADVALVDLNLEEAKKNADFIADKYGVKTMAIRCDVSSEEQVKAMVTQVLDTFGSIDVVHSNAGAIGIGYDNGDIGYEQWKRLIDVNLSGMFLVNQKAAQYMRDSGKGGAIVNTASISGHIVNRSGDRHSVAYQSAKAGVIHLTKAMAMDFCKDNVRINSVSPGDMKSGIHKGIPDEVMDGKTSDIPMKRFGSMNDIGGIVAFLLTDLAAYITGEDILVDGGYCAW